MERSPRVLVFAEARDGRARTRPPRRPRRCATKPDLVLGPADRPHAAAALRGAGPAARGGRGRLQPRDDLQPRRVPRHRGGPPGSYRVFMQPLSLRSRQRRIRARTQLSGRRGRRPRRGVRALRAGDRRAPAASTCRSSASAPTATSASTSPAAELEARTHRVTLQPETRRSNARALRRRSRRASRPKRCRWGWATILQARQAVLLATGETKAALRGTGGERPDHDRTCRRRSSSSTATSRSDPRRGGRGASRAAT